MDNQKMNNNRPDQDPEGGNNKKDDMNKKRLQSIIDSENMKGSVYVSTEVCASYSMKADPDRNTTAELVAGHYSFYQFCTPFPPFKQINNTMEYEAGALTSALSL